MIGLLILYTSKSYEVLPSPKNGFFFLWLSIAYLDFWHHAFMNNINRKFCYSQTLIHHIKYLFILNNYYRGRTWTWGLPCGIALLDLSKSHNRINSSLNQRASRPVITCTVSTWVKMQVADYRECLGHISSPTESSNMYWPRTNVFPLHEPYFQQSFIVSTSNRQNVLCCIQHGELTELDNL